MILLRIYGQKKEQKEDKKLLGWEEKPVVMGQRIMVKC